MSSDEEVRSLERTWRASGSDDDGAAWLGALLRAGTLDEDRVRRLALLGLGAATAYLGEEAPDTALFDHEELPTSSELRAGEAAEALGATLPAGAMRDFARMRIQLLACDDAPLDVVQRTAAWLDDLSPRRPRWLRVATATERPRFLTDLAETAAEWALARTRQDPATPPVPAVRGSFVFVTLRRDPEDWFARHSPSVPHISVVHLGEQARTTLEASPEVFLAHFVAKKALDGLLGADAPRHERARGCAFDSCGIKKTLDARILAGAVCRECHDLLRRNRGLRAEHRTALLEVLAAARERMLAARVT